MATQWNFRSWDAGRRLWRVSNSSHKTILTTLPRISRQPCYWRATAGRRRRRKCSAKGSKPPRAEETSTRIAKCKACSTIYKMTSDDLAFPFGVEAPGPLGGQKVSQIGQVLYHGRDGHAAKL